MTDDTEKRPQQSVNNEMATEPQEEEEDDNLPIDRGWAWVIVGATFCINFLQVGVYRSFGILFVEFLKEFNASTSFTSLTMGIYAGTYSFTALIVLSIAINKFGVRKTCVLGCLIMSIGSMLGYFAMNLEFLIVTQGLFQGFGSATLYGPGIVIIGQYFEKRRALAQAISSCGVSLGSMAIPQLVRYLLNEYGLRGTLLITGALLSEMTIFALLYRPAPIRKKPEKEINCNHPLDKIKEQIGVPSSFEILSIESLDSVSSAPVDTTGTGTAPKADSGIHSDADLPASAGNHPSLAKILLQKKEPFRARTESDPTARLRRPEDHHLNSAPKHTFLSNTSINRMTASRSNRSISSKRENDSLHVPHAKSSSSSQKHLGSLVDTLSQSHFLKYASNADFMVSTFTLAQTKAEEPESRKKSFCEQIKGSFDLSVFKNVNFYLIIAYNTTGVCAVSLFGAYVPAAAEEVGVTPTQAALLITIYAGVDCLSRFLSGILVESGTIRAHHLLSISLISIGILYQLTKFYTSMNLLIMFSALFGMFSGSLPAMNPVVMVEFVGIDLFPKVLGFVQVVQGVGIAGVHPLLGALRDITGTYQASFHFLGASSILASVILLMEPLARRYERSQKKKSDAEENTALNGAATRMADE